MQTIPRATGCTICAADLLKEDKTFSITDFGACANGNPITNTNAINEAIMAASNHLGGTVIFPSGDFKCYTIRLQSNVNLYFMKGAIVHAAKTTITSSYEKQLGEGGNYEEPEINLYAGLQDHGHSFFANSLIYGVDIENVMIYGEGLIDGSAINDVTTYREYVLQGGDPFDQPMRCLPGHTGEWFGNKAIALVRCQNVVLKDFSILIGGHFAIIAEGVTNLLTQDLLVDTTRDAFDIDCCENVTVRNCTFNSLTDDALVIKASYGAGIFMPTKNVLITDCVVSGYDAGSVYAKTYSTDKLIATDRCPPTARVKLGTESTCGYDLVTIERVRFERSRGFALEAVDISNLSNIIFTDCVMDNVSSSPIFIRIGERGRFPVTGSSTVETVIASSNNVRLDDKNWVLPNTDAYQSYPAKRYIPSYNYSKVVSVDGYSEFSIIDEEQPTNINPANYVKEDGHYYLLSYDETTKQYLPDKSREITKEELPRYANAVGSTSMPKVHHIEISNIKVTNADPRYPVLLLGLVDSKIEHIYMKNIEITYRGGLTMEHATEQRQLNTNWEYTQFETKPSVQTLPWLVNTFFLKHEGLLPRVSWNANTNTWINDPYNVPELPRVYPEPSNFGILPAYGLYARHVSNLLLENVRFSYLVEDERHSIVLDNVNNVALHQMSCSIKPGVATIAKVTNHFKRHTNYEYIKNEPYFTTTVSNLTTDIDSTLIEEVTVNAPAPGTPRDELYEYPTVPVPANGYSYEIDTNDYPLPLTVYRPFFVPIKDKIIPVNTSLSFQIEVRNPAIDQTSKQSESMIYNEAITKREYVVETKANYSGRFSISELPSGASFNESTGEFSWTPTTVGDYQMTITYDDRILLEHMNLAIHVIE